MTRHSTVSTTLRALIYSAAVFAGTATGSPAQQAAAADAAVDAMTAYRPLAPCRLLDTRDADHSKPGTGSTLNLAIRGQCGVAATATAVAVNITITGANGPGFITAWPSGQPMPTASTSNYTAGATRANGAILSLGADGSLSIFASASTHIVVDVSGEFYATASSTSGRFIPMPPTRLVDTRASGVALPRGGTVDTPLPAGVPSDATALAVMLTITEAPAGGFVAAFAAGSARPFTSSLNTDAPHQIRTATQIVPVSPAGLTAFTNVGGHIIIDYVGYFTGASAPNATSGLFVPATPTRILDTRVSTQVWPGGTVAAMSGGVTGSNAAAVAANITVTQSGPAGYITAWAAQTPQPGTPAVSYNFRRETVANLGLVSVSTAGVAVSSTTGAHVVIDITGWFTGTPEAISEPTPTNIGPSWQQPTGPIGCMQFIPAPSADGIYRINIGTNQTVVHIFSPGWRGPIVVVGDSLTVGSATQTARALRANGWGPICIDGTVARSVQFGSSSVPTGLSAVNRIRSSNPIWNDPSITWVVALGTNDAMFSAGNAARSDRYVAEMRAAIGANPIWWMNVRTARPEFQFSELMFNASITNSGVDVIDWASVSAGKGWTGGDQIHLGTVGYQARADLLARTVSTS